EPGAEKILLFALHQPILALDSNGLRVLLRLGYGTEERSYAATYRSVQDAASAQLSSDPAALIQAHLLLRRHRQEICRRSDPCCAACPLSDECPSSRAPAGADGSIAG